MDKNYKGISVNLDLPGQVEYNRRKNVEQDQRLSTLSSQVTQLLQQAPSGYLPQVFYGLTRGTQKYRFVPNYVFNVEGLTGNTGDSYELYSDDQTGNYVKAIAVQLNPTQLQIIIQGDYIVDTNTFNLVNMRTGAVVNATLSNVLTLQDASYLGSFSAVDNKEKQITVLYDLASGKTHVVYASIDYNSDGIYNWVSIGNFVNGIDGRSIFGLTASTASGVFAVAKVNDLLVSGEDFTYEGHDYKIGDLDSINTLDPITLVSKGNIRGATGLQGIQGNPGVDGANGLTPYIGYNGNWWIGDTDTTVRAEPRDGVDGVDGQAFNIQSGLYSVPANVGNPNNLDPNGNALTTLPTLPQTDISGKGYVVYDPITTPLEPYYDLYWANNGDTNWTIVHPFSGIKGQDGKDGYTPYIQNNVWYINGVSTGIQATGNTGAKGDKGDKGDTGPKGDSGDNVNIVQTTGTSTTSVMSQKAVTDNLALKQAALASGTNIKTINSQSILGSGNLEISGGSSSILGLYRYEAKKNIKVGGYTEIQASLLESYVSGELSIGTKLITSNNKLLRITGSNYPHAYNVDCINDFSPSSGLEWHIGMSLSDVTVLCHENIASWLHYSFNGIGGSTGGDTVLTLNFGDASLTIKGGEYTYHEEFIHVTSYGDLNLLLYHANSPSDTPDEDYSGQNFTFTDPDGYLAQLISYEWSGSASPPDEATTMALLNEVMTLT